MTADFARRAAYLAYRQGLDGRLQGASADAVLQRAGWARSVGGANPYLTLFSRAAISREQAEMAARQRLIHELPSARGCTYVLPEGHFGLGLTLSRGNGSDPEIAMAKKHLGVTEEELARLQAGVLKAIRDEAKNPKSLREELGDLVRPLGEAGKRRGVSTTLPLVLGRLQQSGQVRRVPVDGRLDHERYLYIAWPDCPPDAQSLAPEQAAAAIAEEYWKWIGLASLEHFKWFTGLSVKACKEAVAALELVPVSADSVLLTPRALLPEWESYKAPSEPDYRFVSALDSILLLRRSLDDALDEAGRQHAGVLSRNLMDLESHPILDRGRIIGLWEYDAENQELVWRTWSGANDALTAKAAEHEAFIRDQLGDARSFSLDSPASRRAQIEKVKSISP